MAEKQIEAEEQYETEVKFYNRYNHGATADMRPGLVDTMNEIIESPSNDYYQIIRSILDIMSPINPSISDIGFTTNIYSRD